MKQLLLILFSLALFTSCKKEQESPVIIDNGGLVDKWGLVEGTYNVYEPNGSFQHTMDIEHSFNSNVGHDSLTFINLQGEFNFSVKQPLTLSDSDLVYFIGYHDTLFDSNGKRWTLTVQSDSLFNNEFRNDTLYIGFRKTNINYYLEDFVPYVDTFIRQIAVKQ